MHGLADIDHHATSEIRVLLKLFDEKTIGLGPHLPVQVPQIIAQNVLAMLQELDAMAEERTAVHAGNESFHHMPSAQVQPGNSGYRFRMKKAAGVVRSFGHQNALSLSPSPAANFLGLMGRLRMRKSS
jgi:hypothetical protein